MCAHRIEFSRTRSATRLESGQMQHFVVLADLAGGTADGPLRLDRDNLAQVLESLTAELAVTLRHGETEHQDRLRFSSPEDLEPDAIARQLGVVQRLVELRRQLAQNDRAAEAAAELGDFLGYDPDQVAGATEPAPSAPAADAAGEDEFEALLSADRRPPQPKASFVSRLLANEADPNVPDHAALVTACNELIGDFVNQALSAPGFRQLERTWRGIIWLASELDLDEEVGLWLLPVDFTRLAGGADLQPIQAALARLNSRLDGERLEAVAIDAPFETPEALALLDRFCALAASLDCLLLVKAPAGLSGDNSTLALEAGYPTGSPALLEAWQSLREQPQASHCAAALPRFLLRLPYGAKGEATDLPGFEELKVNPDHERFLWINPVYALIYVMCTEDAADLTIQDLPMPVYEDGSGSAVMPCAEAYLSESDVAALHDHAVMVLQSYRNRNALQLSGLFALA